jgi:hypothetical protein
MKFDFNFDVVNNCHPMLTSEKRLEGKQQEDVRKWLFARWPANGTNLQSLRNLALACVRGGNIQVPWAQREFTYKVPDIQRSISAHACGLEPEVPSCLILFTETDRSPLRKRFGYYVLYKASADSNLTLRQVPLADAKRYGELDDLARVRAEIFTIFDNAEQDAYGWERVTLDAAHKLEQGIQCSREFPWLPEQQQNAA